MGSKPIQFLCERISLENNLGILSNWILGPVGRQGLIGFPGQNIQGPKGIFMFILLLTLLNSNKNDYLLIILFTL